jgi:hypothetical protein
MKITKKNYIVAYGDIIQCKIAMKAFHVRYKNKHVIFNLISCGIVVA